MRYILLLPLLLLLLLSSLDNYGQDRHKVDSLTQLIQITDQDTTKVDALLGLAEEFYLSNPDTAFEFCEKALLTAEKATLKEEMAGCFGNLAYLLEQKGDFSKALEYNLKCVKIFEELIEEKKLGGKTFLKKEKIFKKEIAASYNNIGAIYDDQGNIEKGLEYYFLSLKIREEIKDKKGMAMSYNNLGYLYDNQG